MDTPVASPARSVEKRRARRGSWTHFTCGYLVAALGQFLSVSSQSLGLHLLLVATVALGFGVLAGRYGDRAWRWIADVVT